jgi:hypothetical protein
MQGKLEFNIALKKRLDILQATYQDIEQLITVLNSKISPGFKNYQSCIEQYWQNLYIISGGFKEYNLTIVTSLGFLENHVFANNFLYDSNNQIIGFDNENPLAHSKGKSLVATSLNLSGTITVIGDGYTDYEIKEAGKAHSFFLYTEHIDRSFSIPYFDKKIASIAFLCTHD